MPSVLVIHKKTLILTYFVGVLVNSLTISDPIGDLSLILAPILVHDAGHSFGFSIAEISTNCEFCQTVEQAAPAVEQVVLKLPLVLGAIFKFVDALPLKFSIHNFTHILVPVLVY